MTRKVWPHLAALAGFCLLAVLFTYPTVLHFTTRHVGLRNDDTGLTFWSMWYFRHALTVLHTNPLWTDLMYWPYGGNLLLINFALFNDVLAFFMIPSLGLVGTYNLILLGSLTLAAYGTFLLLRDWKMRWDIAFVGAAAFAFSPTAAMQGNQRELVFACVNALPFFFWALFRTIRDGKLIYALLTALCLTWIWSYNYYYFIFSGLAIAFCYWHQQRPFDISFERRPASLELSRAKLAVNLAIVPALAYVLYSVFGKGQVSFHGSGSLGVLLAYVAPYLAFWGLLTARLVLSWAPRPSFDAGALRREALFPYAATLGCWAAINLPMICASVTFMLTGDYGTTSKPWRGGGDPVDPLWLLMPSANNPLFSGWLPALWERLRLGDRMSVECLGLVPLAAILWLWRRRPSDRWTSLWFALLAFFLVLTLGPWLKLLGVHTYLPLPFYVLHLLPVYNSVSSGAYFTVHASFFIALLLAVALKEMTARAPAKLGAWLPAAAFLLLALEFHPGKRPMADLAYTPLIHRLADRPDGAMLPVPFRVHFPRLVPYGLLGEPWLEITTQTVHHKPIMGGFLSRVAKRVHQTISRDEFIQGLLSAQSGGPPIEALKDPRRVGRYFREMRLRYVIVQSALVPPALAGAMKTWPMRLLDQEGTVRVYETTGL